MALLLERSRKYCRTLRARATITPGSRELPPPSRRNEQRPARPTAFVAWPPPPFPVSGYRYGLPAEQRFRFGIQQNPKRVDAQRGAEREAEDVQDADDDRDDPRPRLHFQQSDAGQHPGQRDEDQKAGDGGADRTGDKHGLMVAGNRAAEQHDRADAEPDEND